MHDNCNLLSRGVRQAVPESVDIMIFHGIFIAVFQKLLGCLLDKHLSESLLPWVWPTCQQRNFAVAEGL